MMLGWKLIAFAVLIQAVVFGGESEPTVEDILTYKSFCSLDGARFPLSALNAADDQLRLKEATFWGMIYLKHSVAAEKLYAEIVEITDRIEKGTGTYLQDQLTLMQHAMAKLPKDASPCLSCDAQVRSIYEKIAAGKYCDAHNEILSYHEGNKETGLGARLMIAKGVAQFPLATYSPATGKVLLTEDLEKNLQLLISVHCVGASVDEEDANEGEEGMKKHQLASLMFVNWTAGKWKRAAKLASGLCESNKHGVDAAQILAAVQLCSDQETGAKAAETIYQKLIDVNFSDTSEKAPPAVTTGLRLAKLGLTKARAVELYAQLVNSGEDKGRFPLLMVGPASPAVNEVIIPSLGEEALDRVHLPPEKVENITKDPIPEIVTPVTDKGEVIDVAEVSGDATPLITVSDIDNLPSTEGTVERVKNKIHQIPEGMTVEEYEEMLRKVKAGLTSIGKVDATVQKNEVTQVIAETKKEVKKGKVVRVVEVQKEELTEFQKKLAAIKEKAAARGGNGQLKKEEVKVVQTEAQNMLGKLRKVGEPVKTLKKDKVTGSDHSTFSNISSFDRGYDLNNKDVYVPYYQKEEVLLKDKD